MIEFERLSASSGVVDITIIDGDYTATPGDTAIFSSGETIINLLTASWQPGKLFHIKNIGTDTLTIVCYGSETIDGDSVVELECQYESITIISDGSNWHIV